MLKGKRIARSDKNSQLKRLNARFCKSGSTISHWIVAVKHDFIICNSLAHVWRKALKLVDVGIVIQSLQC